MNNHTTHEIPYGYCQCGCGQKTEIAKRTRTEAGWTKGQPMRYLFGHKGLENTPQENPNPSGLCMCGCGEVAPIAERSNGKLGHVAGQPICFIVGHHNKIRPLRPAEDRFWEKVIKRGPDECWDWNGSHDQHGYGQLRIDGHNVRAHRFSYKLHKGPIPDGKDVCHDCDYPPCTNPVHLFAGTAKDNLDDMVAKGRTNNYEGGEHPNAMFTNEQVREFRRQFAERDVSFAAFAAFHEVPYMVMFNLLTHRTYKNA